jgi:hypothetical protein
MIEADETAAASGDRAVSPAPCLLPDTLAGGPSR